jgi:arylformamidase
MIYDITLPMTVDLAYWPGDVPYEFSFSATMEGGSTNNIGVIHGSVHFGTHVDAPFHFERHGATIEELDLSTYCGPAAVVDATGESEITAVVFDGVDFAMFKRVLVKTGAWASRDLFPADFPVLAKGVADFLKSQGVILLGVDVPSVDKFGAPVITNHYSLSAARIAIIESLDLSEVPAGTYELIALPLKIVGGDGSPVRAILRDLSQGTGRK